MKITPIELSIAGGVLVYFLTSYFKDHNWTDRQKVILFMVVSLVVGTGWYLFGIYPTWFAAVQGVAIAALIVFVALVKLFGIKWQQ